MRPRRTRVVSPLKAGKPKLSHSIGLLEVEISMGALVGDTDFSEESSGYDPLNTSEPDFRPLEVQSAKSSI